MRFLGGKRRKKNAKAKNKGKSNRSVASGFAPAFGRAVGRFAAGIRRGAEAPLYLEATASAKATATPKATASASASWLDDVMHPTHRKVRDEPRNSRE